MIIDIGLWKLDVDVKGTSDYYKQLKINSTDHQSCRNYKAYCRSMSQEEKSFFDMLGIIPEKCDVNYLGITKGKTYPTFGNYLIKGNYINIPKEYSMPLDEFIKQGMNVDISPEYENGSDIIIGKYSIQFLRKESLFHPEPENLPEGYICMEFFAEELPWLLNEKPIHEMYEPSKWWEINKRIKEYRGNRKAQKVSKVEALNAVVQDLKRQRISFKVMPASQVKALKQHWFDTFTPIENRKKAQKVCFSRGNYLWHLFSFEYAECIDGNDAVAQYYNEEKEDCYLFLSFNDIGIRIKHAGRFQWNEIDLYQDIIITDRSFSWTFAKTHEEMCGPYFAYNQRI